jgi:hypothetical protein
MACSLEADDPCTVYRQLRETYLRLLRGEQEYEFEYQGNGVQRRIRYSQIDMNLLQQEMQAQKTLCDAANGLQVGGRVAIQAGALLRRRPFTVVR